MHWLPVIWHVIILQSIIQRQPTTVSDNTHSLTLWRPRKIINNNYSFSYINEFQISESIKNQSA